MMYTALFVRKDSSYKNRDTWDVYDEDRDCEVWNVSLDSFVFQAVFSFLFEC